MKVKDLYPVLFPQINIQIWDSKSLLPLTSKTCFANSEISTYEDKDIYTLIPGVEKDGHVYLAILIETKDRKTIDI